MTQEHSITPPPELVQKWINEEQGVFAEHIATQAARWGADQELEACINWLLLNGWGKAINGLRAARRPKPPSLKEQAQRILVENGTTIDGRIELDPDDIGIIRRAIQSLPS